MRVEEKSAEAEVAKKLRNGSRAKGRRTKERS